MLSVDLFGTFVEHLIDFSFSYNTKDNPKAPVYENLKKKKYNQMTDCGILNLIRCIQVYF